MLDGGRGAPIWIIARGFCAYTVIDAQGVPASRRKGFAALALQRWSPFPDLGHHIEWVGARAMVWAWSIAQVRELPDARVAPLPKKAWPESIFRGQVLDDGICLVADDEGVEGRVWRQGLLAASQWWPETPDLAEWNTFLRGVGQPATRSVPVVQHEVLSSQPWTRQRLDSLNTITGQHRTFLQAGALALAVALLAIPLASSLRIMTKTIMLDRVIAREAAASANLLEAREATERDLAVVDDLLELRPPARQLELMAAVIGAVPGSDWRLLEWTMQDSRTLRVLMQVPNPDPTAIVKALESSRLLSNVSVDLGRAQNEVTIKATVGRARAEQVAAP
ncbi:hypothetical protein GCM10008101_26550 [Lysobacter xinjiangensis]|uniref:General secretion pathway protein L n=1 Tax=Cognatilysobacter xinjiangensis TaxID=546892 RepID=A0ABQ3C6W0_9GAMM|nr:hypothetical protein GCM10008101_26550 [Lysobacter xinjiangensis]